MLIISIAAGVLRYHRLRGLITPHTSLIPLQPPAGQVMVYHGSKRSTSMEELQQADVVLTTYSTIESEFRRYGTGGGREREQEAECAGV